MLKRLRFWLGLLLGSLASFRLPHRTPQKPAGIPAGLLLDLTGDALIVYGSDGAVIYSNAAALTLFGPQAAQFPPLYYSNRQRVPPGQLPLSRVRSTGHFAGARYHCTGASGTACVLDVSAFPIPGGAAVMFRDVTALHESQASLSQRQTQQAALRALGRRLGAVLTLDAISRAVVEETNLALRNLPDVQVRLYGHSAAAQILTRLASEPEDRPKRPQSSAQSQPSAFAFDAGVSALWQLYVDRQPTTAGLSALGEAASASAYALPLLAGGLAVGHLSVSSSVPNAFDDAVVREMLEAIVSMAALALAAPQSAQLTAHALRQRDAIYEIAQAFVGESLPDDLADLAIRHIKRLTGAEVCTVSIASEKGLRIMGTAFGDDLLFPERAKPDSLAPQSKAIQKAWRTQKIVTHLGLTNPSHETAVWRAFAGSGCHSVTALPLASRLGVLAVYVKGALPLPDTQIKFLETIAALLSAWLKPATAEAFREDG